jgi:hypothetical protein
MHNSNSSPAPFQLNTTQAMTGGVLVAAGSLLGIAGAIIGGHAMVMAASRWFGELEVPPTEVVKHKWNQTKAATHAGATAWHGTNGVRAHSARA